MNSRVGQTAALLAILAMVAIPTVASAANPVPCEKALGDLKTAISGATLTDADSALCMLRSVPFGKYWRSNPLVFSLVPRCHGL
jgi:hypothetical protein